MMAVTFEPPSASFLLHLRASCHMLAALAVCPLVLPPLVELRDPRTFVTRLAADDRRGSDGSARSARPVTETECGREGDGRHLPLWSYESRLGCALELLRRFSSADSASACAGGKEGGSTRENARDTAHNQAGTGQQAAGGEGEITCFGSCRSMPLSRSRAASSPARSPASQLGNRAPPDQASERAVAESRRSHYHGQSTHQA
jgi:hypothetical protein